MIRRLRSFIPAVLAIVLLAGGSVAVAQSNVTPQVAGEPGFAYLPSTLNLQPTQSGTWTDSNLQVLLPQPGTYDLDLDVRGVISGIPPINSYISARLFNATSGIELPGTERIVNQIFDSNPSISQDGYNATVPISERITVNGPTIIRLQGMRVNAGGNPTNRAEILSDANGRTSFRFLKVNP
jgi:hypothetical protein